MRVLTGGVAAWLFLGWLWLAGAAELESAPSAGTSQGSAPGTLPAAFRPPLTNAVSVLGLLPAEAARGVPVKIRAQVVYADPYSQVWYLKDASGCIVLVRPSSAAPLTLGEIVEVTGVTGVQRTEITVEERGLARLGTEPLPTAEPITIDQMVAVVADPRWVDLEADVEAVLRDVGDRVHVVLSATRDTRAFVIGFPQGKPLPEHWVDARLRMRGLLTSHVDERGEYQRNWLYVPSGDNVRVVKPRSIEAEQLPRTPLARVLRFRSPQYGSRRVKVVGVVTAKPSKSEFYLQDGGVGIRIHTRQRPDLKPGDWVELTGYPTIDEFTPQIEEAMVTKLGVKPQPIPIRIDGANQGVDLGNYQGLLAIVAGEAVDVIPRGRYAEVVIRAGDQYLSGALFGDGAWNELKQIAAGSQVEVTGVCVSTPGRNSEFLPARFLMRTGADIKMTRPPPWWTLPKVVTAFGALSLLLVYWRVLAWRAHHRSEMRYRQIFNKASEVICVHSVDSAMEDANPAWVALSGLSSTELKATSLQKLVIQEEREDFDRWWAGVLQQGHGSIHQCTIQCREGTRARLEFRASLLRGEDGSVFVETIGRDVSAQWDAEQQRRRLAAIVEFSEDAIIGKTVEGVITSWNRGAEKMFGYTAEEAVGRSLLMIFPPGREGEEERVLAAISRGEVVEHFETVRVRKDGQRIYVSASISPLKDQTGKVIGASKIARDITGRRLAAEAQARLAAVVEQSSETIMLIGSEAEILYVNPTFERVTGHPREMVLGKPVWNLLDEEADGPLHREIAATLEADRVWRGNVRPRRVSGVEPYEAAVVVSTVRDAAGVVTGFVVVARDATRERRLEEQLRQSQKMEAVGMLAGGVAHDFNNILSSMLMQADLARMSCGLPVEVIAGLDQIRKDAQRAADLTRRLLLFSRRQAILPRVLDLNEVLVNLLKMLQRLMREDIQLQLKLAPSPLQAYADPGMIEQLVLNLAVNARDAMPMGGQLLVETTSLTVTEGSAYADPDAKPGVYVGFRISDTGTGIAPDVLPRIFEPFFTTKPKGAGTGLGLATVFGIVKQHHGWITVESKLGEGTTFGIFMPVTDRAPEPAVSAPSPLRYRGGNESVLLVEDEAAMRASTKAVLERCGYRVMEAPNGADAVKLFRSRIGSVDLLITDLVMPGGMSGRDAARELREVKPGLRVLYMSGYSIETAGKEWLLGPGEAFLQKPFEAGAFLETVRRLLDG